MGFQSSRGLPAAALAAIPLLSTAMNRYREIDYGRGIQSALGQLGVAYAALGQPSQAFAVGSHAITLTGFVRLKF